MLVAIAALAAALVATAAPSLADTPVCDFSDIAAWQPNADGGNAAKVSLDRDHPEHGPAMRLTYTDSAPHWGNLTRPCSVPAEARALHFWVYKRSAGAAAGMFIWLFEPDGDAWMLQVPFGAKTLGSAPEGWQEVRMPIGDFQFQPRGKQTREFMAISRILIGFNIADAEVSVAAMTWEAGPGGVALPLPKTPDLKLEAGALGSIGILDMGGNGRIKDATTGEALGTAHAPRAFAAALRAGGIRTLAKTTGTEPRLILEDGSERPWPRPGAPRAPTSGCAGWWPGR